MIWKKEAESHTTQRPSPSWMAGLFVGTGLQRVVEYYGDNCRLKDSMKHITPDHGFGNEMFAIQ